MKAYLSLQGVSLVKLSEYGHNLDALLSAADAKQLQDLVGLTDEQRAEVRKASDYYAGKVFEYPAMGEALDGLPGLPNFEILSAAAQVLVDGLELPCREAR